MSNSDKPQDAISIPIEEALGFLTSSIEALDMILAGVK
jgi:hypothetical protein